MKKIPRKSMIQSTQMKNRKQVEAQEAEKLSEMQRQLQESAQKGQEIAKGNNSAEMIA